MGRNTRKRRTSLTTKVIAGTAALALGGGGLVWANFYASAHESNSARNQTRTSTTQVATISCPDVGQRLTQVPRGARRTVAKELASLDRQVTNAYTRLASTRQAQAGDASYVDNAILSPLKAKRTATIDRINVSIKRAGGRSQQNLQQYAQCQGVPADNTNDDGQNNDDGQDQNNDGQDQNNDGQDQNDDGQEGNGGQAGNGPNADDFVDITQVQQNAQQGINANGLPANGDSGSTGSFTTSCGTNENELRNSDNVIVAPGVSNGAQHQHDYVGNQANNAFASDEDLANGATTCENQDDRSSYFWPVLRVQDGQNDVDAGQPGGGQDLNVGTIVQVSEAQLTFVGNKTSDVVAMPQALRIITGDAKAFVNGLANANTNWSCTGFEDKVQLHDKYPICPEGSSVVRTSNFQSCWDGQNIDSANHRTHVAFVQADGTCANNFVAIPQLQVRLVYDVQAPTVENGQVQNAFAVDSFPDNLHKAVTDHNDFINFFSEDLMNEMVNCINSGQNCQ